MHGSHVLLKECVLFFSEKKEESKGNKRRPKSREEQQKVRGSKGQDSREGMKEESEGRR